MTIVSDLYQFSKSTLYAALEHPVVESVVSISIKAWNASKNLLGQGYEALRTLVDLKTLSAINDSPSTKQLLLQSMRVYLLDYVAFFILLNQMHNYLFPESADIQDDESYSYAHQTSSVLMALITLNGLLWVNLDNIFYSLALCTHASSEENPKYKPDDHTDINRLVKSKTANIIASLNYSLDLGIAFAVAIGSRFFGYLISKPLIGVLGFYASNVIKASASGRASFEYLFAFNNMTEEEQVKCVRQNQGYFLMMGAMYLALSEALSRGLKNATGVDSDIVSFGISCCLSQYFMLVALYSPRPLPDMDKLTDFTTPLYKLKKYFVNEGVNYGMKHLQGREPSRVSWANIQAVCEGLIETGVFHLVNIASLGNFSSLKQLFKKQSIHTFLNDYETPIRSLIGSQEQSSATINSMIELALKMMPTISRPTLYFMRIGSSFYSGINPELINVLEKYRTAIDASSGVMLLLQENRVLLISHLKKMLSVKTDTKPQEWMMSRMFNHSSKVIISRLESTFIPDAPLLEQSDFASLYGVTHFPDVSALMKINADKKNQDQEFVMLDKEQALSISAVVSPVLARLRTKTLMSEVLISENKSISNNGMEPIELRQPIPYQPAIPYVVYTPEVAPKQNRERRKKNNKNEIKLDDLIVAQDYFGVKNKNDAACDDFEMVSRPDTPIEYRPSYFSEGLNRSRGLSAPIELAALQPRQ